MAFSATGGTKTTDGFYTVHKFTSSGSLVCTGTKDSSLVEVLIVGGGGGGGSGGGGAGGYVTGSVTLTGSMTVTVGNGGAGKYEGTQGDDGQDSSFGGLTAYGGGGGGAVATSKYDGRSGASGGGGSSHGTITTNGGSATHGSQGNTGGNGGLGSPYPAGGGGGASAVGQNNPDTTHGGNGGAGYNNDIVLRGTNVGYAGGGGGSVYNATATAGTATHGGGAGGVDADGTSATANTGGGGGGAGQTNTGGNGGSGIVVVRYLSDYLVTPTGIAAPLGTTLSTTDVIPTMTGNSTPSGVASANSQYNSGSAAYIAFNDVITTGTGWHSANSGSAGPYWLKYQFPEPTIIGRYTLRSNGNDWTWAPETWKFQGSADDSAWTDLDSQTSVTDWRRSTNTKKTYDISSPDRYTYYRVYVTATAGNYCSICEAEMFGYAEAIGAPLISRSIKVTGIASAEVLGTAIVDAAAGWSATLVINANATTTSSTNVTLTIEAQFGASEPNDMCFSEDNENWSSWEAYDTTKSYTLSGGYGTKTVYGKFRCVYENGTTIQSSTDGRIYRIDYSNPSVYATVREGGGEGYYNAGFDPDVGQYLGGAPTPDYSVMQGEMRFDTSSMAAKHIYNVTLYVTGHTDYTTGSDFIMEARAASFGASLDNTDFVAGSTLSSHTLLASYDTADGWPESDTTWIAFVSESTFASNINRLGNTDIVMASANQRTNTAPTADERAGYTGSGTSTSMRPKLVFNSGYDYETASDSILYVASTTVNLGSPDHLGIATAEALGTVTVLAGKTITGIPSGEAFGTPTVTTVTTVEVDGLDTAEAVGDVTTSVVCVIHATGIPSAEAFGTVFVPLGYQTVHPTGIPSAEAFGTAAPQYKHHWVKDFMVNDDDATTSTRSVTLDMDVTCDGETPDDMRFSNDNATWSDWETYGTSHAWTLTAGAGTKTVYAQFRKAEEGTQTVKSWLEGGQTSVSYSGIYSNAREGVESVQPYGEGVTSDGWDPRFGQYYDQDDYYVEQGFVSFDTSAVVGPIYNVALELYAFVDYAWTDFIAEARLTDVGDHVTAADFVAGSQLSSHTLLATIDSASGWEESGEHYKAFTSEPIFVNAINRSGHTDMVIASRNQMTGTPPAEGQAGDERLAAYGYGNGGDEKRPKLVFNSGYDYAYDNDSIVYAPEWSGVIVINNDDATCTSTSVTLTLDADFGGDAPDQMCFSNDLITWSDWETYDTTKSWTLTAGEGTKTVYAMFRMT